MTNIATIRLQEFDPTNRGSTSGQNRRQPCLKEGVPLVPARLPPHPQLCLLQWRQKSQSVAINESVNPTPRYTSRHEYIKIVCVMFQSVSNGLIVYFSFLVV